MMKHNEDSRVKIPALLHFLRLGYTYQTKRNQNIDEKNNIFIDIFKQSIRDINHKDYDDKTLDDLVKEIATLTDNEVDKGQNFFERLIKQTGIKLLDLEHFENNDFRVVTELSFRNEVAFRPDITILINGIPLGFVEAKKPNNRSGLSVEFERMEDRMSNKKFIRFINQLQVLGFSNNMPYDDTTRKQNQGSYYTTPNFEGTKYNYFREEHEIAVNEYIKPNDVDYVLSDNAMMSIKSTPEFQTNLKPDTFTNQFITSVFSPERLIFIIRYGIVYVNSKRDGNHKHIIRYPQLFAIQALIPKLKQGLKKGVVWHTQGSGKTALSYFAANVLRDYYREKNIVTKFFFVVDRLDLLIQATTEFSSRGFTIASINSRKEFAENIKSSEVVAATKDGNYKETMNVVNIQKFSDESTAKIETRKKIQRVYFLDEAHRSYNPKGSFLANLFASDPDGIFIGLTGTPILSKDRMSTDIFKGGYIHKYYYNKSIADGYTLKIKKENIATQFRDDIRRSLGIEENEKIPSALWKEITKEKDFVDKLCRYIIEDFDRFKGLEHIMDNSVGSMIVTSSSTQAKLVKEWFDTHSNFKSALVLHDEDDNKEKQDNFRGTKNEDGIVESEYEGVVVYNMLLTGFDAPRLKRLYLLREIKEHNLLQTLARVNRPYKDFKYGYVVDFVDITEQYKETNRRYLEELKKDIEDDELFDVSDMIVDVEKIQERVEEIEEKLFRYMGNIETNLEEFRFQLEPLDEKELREIRSILQEYKECYYELKASHVDVSPIPIDRIKKAHSEVANRISLKMAERIVDDPDIDISDVDFTQLVFEFFKKGEIDLEFSPGNEILDIINKIKNAFYSNMDKDDKAFTELNQEFREVIKKFREEADTVEKVKVIIDELNDILNRALRLNNENTSLTNTYRGDDSCMRIHKRLSEKYSNDLKESKINKIMIELIQVIDENINTLGVPDEAIVKRRLLRPIKKAFERQGIPNISARQAEIIATLFAEDRFNK